MGFKEQVKARARLAVKRIVLPEGDEPRTVQAAAILAAEKIAEPVLLGDPARIQAVAAETGADAEDVFRLMLHLANNSSELKMDWAADVTESTFGVR